MSRVAKIWVSFCLSSGAAACGSASPGDGPATSHDWSTYCDVERGYTVWYATPLARDTPDHVDVLRAYTTVGLDCEISRRNDIIDQFALAQPSCPDAWDDETIRGGEGTLVSTEGGVLLCEVDDGAVGLADWCASSLPCWSGPGCPTLSEFLWLTGLSDSTSVYEWTGTFEGDSQYHTSLESCSSDVETHSWHWIDTESYSGVLETGRTPYFLQPAGTNVEDATLEMLLIAPDVH
jgi:hypothetical protein